MTFKEEKDLERSLEEIDKEVKKMTNAIVKGLIETNSTDTVAILLALCDVLSATILTHPKETWPVVLKTAVTLITATIEEAKKDDMPSGSFSREEEKKEFKNEEDDSPECNFPSIKV